MDLLVKDCEKFIGMNVGDVKLPESDEYIIANISYKYKNCGKRYPTDKLKLEPIDLDNLISFEDLFLKHKLLIFWNYNSIVTDLEVYNLVNDFDLLYDDYLTIKNSSFETLREGDTRYLGAGLLKNNKRCFVLRKGYLEKILSEMQSNSFCAL